MDVSTAKHITTITVPNCRYIVFKDGYAYVSSYAGPVLIDLNARLGYVAKIDTATMTVVDTCTVGYQPEEMVIKNNKLYVANSGGYRVPNYDNTVSVIDLDSFTETKKIVAGINSHRLELDKYGFLYVSSRGDNYPSNPSRVYIIDTAKDYVTKVLELPVSNMTLSGDSLYAYSTEWSKQTESNTISYAIVDTKSQTVISDNFITDGTEQNIDIPYGIVINPETKEILITDAKDYITPGTLHCYSPEGEQKWSTVTGDIPAHIVFTDKKLKSNQQ
ncbi:MAG: hypothetical protein ACK5JS_00065 [Mangrovibacterium sp.]